MGKAEQGNAHGGGAQPYGQMGVASPFHMGGVGGFPQGGMPHPHGLDGVALGCENRIPNSTNKYNRSVNYELKVF